MFYKKFLSIDIGNRYIKIVELSVWRKKITIHNTFTISTPEGSFHDGKIYDLLKIKLVISEALKENKITASQVVYASVCSNMITRIMKIPVGTANKLLKKKDICSLIRNEVQQYLSMDMDNYIVDFAHLELLDHEGNTIKIKKKRSLKITLRKQKKLNEKPMMGRVRAVVYPKEVAEGYYGLSLQLKRNPIALDINSNSCCKLISYSKNINGIDLEKDCSYVFIDIGYELCNLFVIKNDKLQFHRMLNNSIGDIDNEIISFNALTMEAAELIRKESYIVDINTNDVEGMGNPNRILTKYANELANTISRVIQYYNNENKDNNIIKIYLFGGGCNIKGIEKLLYDITNIKIEKIISMDKIEGEIQNLELYINAIGAAIRR